MLLISALALFAAPALADGGNGNGGGGHGPWSDGGGETPEGAGPNEDMYHKGVNNSLMGKMSYAYGHGQGGFVFYTVDEENGTITDYGLFTSDGEKALIDSISVEGFVPEEIDVHGSIAKLIEDGAIAVLHDNPTGMYHLFVEEATNVTIVLSGDMAVTENKVLNESSNLSYQLVISDGRSTGVVASDDPFEVAGNGTVITCHVTEHLMVRFLPQVAHRHQWMEMALMQAVQDGRVAAEVTLVGNGEGGIYDTVSYRQELDVQVQHVVKNKFRLMAQGENAKGALMLVHTEAGTMDMAQDRLRVRLNDQELRYAEDPLELIYGQPEEACYSVISDGEVQQMLVYLPASTLGSISVESIDPLSSLFSPSGLAIIVGAMALVALAGVVAFRKR
jgi:hypothetical protein